MLFQSLSYFWDDNGKWFEGAVDRIAEIGLTAGCGGGRYCGDDQITRGQMVTLLRRSESPAGSPIVEPMPDPPSTTTTTTTTTTTPPNCDPSYPTVCIPPPPPDLNCPDISHRNFQVIGNDPHGFDVDDDGIGCEED